ncbi:MAG: hypothetical protein GYB21_00960 [Oceanospirillales bacterium]|nr:hypothetical protein [Oceanospirillales bacterium]
MEPKLPIPTDSLYKFGALFGLALTIASMAFFVVNVNTANDRINQYREAIFEIDNSDDQNKSLRIMAYQNQIEAAKSDHRLYAKVLSGMMGVGAGFACIGFFIWAYQVQPIQLEMLRLEKQKLALEVSLLEQKLTTDKAPIPKQPTQVENSE